MTRCSCDREPPAHGRVGQVWPPRRRSQRDSGAQRVATPLKQSFEQVARKNSHARPKLPYTESEAMCTQIQAY